MILQDTHTTTNHSYLVIMTLMMMAVVLVIKLITIQWKSGGKNHVESFFVFVF